VSRIPEPLGVPELSRTEAFVHDVREAVRDCSPAGRRGPRASGPLEMFLARRNTSLQAFHTSLVEQAERGASSEQLREVGRRVVQHIEALIAARAGETPALIAVSLADAMREETEEEGRLSVLQTDVLCDPQSIRKNRALQDGIRRGIQSLVRLLMATEQQERRLIATGRVS
jgi:plasmid stabilization system protein ParE